VSLFTGSAVLTAVIGLSLRDTLGNLFAGLALQAQRPFVVGDWVQYGSDAANVGQVLEINWRATRLVTADQVELVVPNAMLAQVPIINFSRPTARVRRSVIVYGPYAVPPPRVHRAVLAALADAPGVLADPPPSVATTGFDDRGIQYTIRFYVNEFSARGRAESAVRERLWYALHRGDVPLGTPTQDVRLHRGDGRAEADGAARRAAALGGVDFFAHLSDEERRRLAERSRYRPYAPGEVVIQQGEPGDELFVIESGEVAVSVEWPGGQREVARLGPGEFFGEMAALTGEPRHATVRATRECELLVVGKAALAQLFEESPELTQLMSMTIARRQAGLTDNLHGESTVMVPPQVNEQGNHLLQRIKEFFSV
jgi:CRP-like cAMP-binding protein